MAAVLRKAVAWDQYMLLRVLMREYALSRKPV
jgi:hypothetical protein